MMSMSVTAQNLMSWYILTRNYIIRKFVFAESAVSGIA